MDLEDMVARTNIVSRQGEAVTVDQLNPLTFNGAVSRVQEPPFEMLKRPCSWCYYSQMTFHFSHSLFDTYELKVGAVFSYILYSFYDIFASARHPLLIVLPRMCRPPMEFCTSWTKWFCPKPGDSPRGTSCNLPTRSLVQWRLKNPAF